MAENRLTDEGGVIRDPEHLLPERASAGQPGQIAATDDPDVARAEIEQTRARMSSTIDQLESALLRKKEQIQEKLDVMAPVRERPLPSAALVFAGGLVLGFLTGGGKDHDDRDDGQERGGRSRRRRGRAGSMESLSAGLDVELDLEGDEAWGDDWRARAREWERRSRQLMKTCNRQEEELRAMRQRLALSGGEGSGSEGDGGLGVLAGAVSTLRDGLLGGLADAVSNAFHSLRRGGGDEGGDTLVFQQRSYALDAPQEEALQQEYNGEPLADDYDQSHLHG